MKNYIKEIYKEEEHDGFCFYVDDKSILDISPFNYKRKSKPLFKNDIGYKYHILTYKEDDDGSPYEVEHFDAILGDPYHHASILINLGYFGTLCKITKSSNKIIKDLFKQMKQHEKMKGGK